MVGHTGTCGGSLHAGPRLENGLSGTATGMLVIFFHDYSLDNLFALRYGVNTATGYGMAHGRAYCEGVNVQWALGDATAAEGGCFVCIPGTIDRLCRTTFDTTTSHDHAM
eukprot:COSAG02_NODE_9682_length_2142_cov_1.923152_2_plen_110_part_00